MRFLMVVLMLSVLLGVAGASEPTYKGQALSQWVSLARDIDRDTRLNAITALSKIGLQYPEVKTAMMGAADDDDLECRLVAVKAISSFESPTEDMAELLASLLQEDEAQVREIAKRGLVEYGEVAVPALKKVIGSEDTKSIVKEAELVMLEIDGSLLPPNRVNFVIRKALAEPPNAELHSQYEPFILKLGDSALQELFGSMRLANAIVKARAAIIILRLDVYPEDINRQGVEQLIYRGVLVRKADELGYDKDPSVVSEVEQVRARMEGNPVFEDAFVAQEIMRAKYDKMIEALTEDMYYERLKGDNEKWGNLIVQWRREYGL